MIYLMAILLAYLLGSFPTGYLLGRMMGNVDVREIGSGRTGGSNVLRSAGKKAGVATMILDVAKGALAVVLARLIFANDPTAVALAALFAVIGHNHSIFLKFRGGAGTMTGAGALLGLSPLLLLLTSIIPITFAYITRMTSIGSLLAGAIGVLIGCVLIWQEYFPAQYLLFFLPYLLISWQTHIPNIQRLRAGTERRVGQKAKPQA
ncbi:MAG: glycerol-3-phosphate 1-O-acyltransferase PlsY [Ardenticatenaceae bacterium]